MRFILLNGPPRSGKDTLGRVILEIMSERGKVCILGKFAKVLKERTHALYGLVDDQGRPVPHDAFENEKDEEMGDFFGITPRRAYIEVSEGHLKRLHGPEVLGGIFADEIARAEAAGPVDLVVVTDAGFAAEAMPLVRKWGADRVRLFRIFRNGTNFDGDSRSYYDLPGVETFNIENNGSIEDLKTAVFAWRG